MPEKDKPASQPKNDDEREELETPHEHAVATKRIRARRTVVPGQASFRYVRSHALAAHVHGWDASRRFTGAEPKISRAHYESALKAVSTRFLEKDGKPVLKDGKPVRAPLAVHKPACSEYAPKDPFGLEGSSR